MYTIDSISFFSYGLFLSEYDGQADLLDPKNQFFTVYAKEGYQITKRTGNILEINGFVIGMDQSDFIAKVQVLQGIFKAPGTRTIILDNNPIECFCVNGFEVTNVHLSGIFYGKIKIKLIIV